jgi:parallel beta-helix repeat protein
MFDSSPGPAPVVLAVVAVVRPTATAGGGRGAATATPTQIDGCTTIDSPGTYALAADIQTGDHGDCIRITAPGVVLDGADHTVTGPWTDSDGVYSAAVNVTAGNVTVEHLTVTDWAQGVAVADGADAVTVADVTAEHVWFGVHLGQRTGVDDSLVTDVHLDVVRTGISIGPGSANNTVTNTTSTIARQQEILLLADAHDNVVRANDVGEVSLEGASENRLVDNAVVRLGLADADANEVVGNVFDGVGIDVRGGSTDNTIRDNVVRGGVTGIHVRDSTGTRIVDNTIRDASWWGVEVTYAPNTTVRSNRVSGHHTGITIVGTGPVRVVNNTVTNNSDTGIDVSNAADTTVAGNEVLNASEDGIRVWVTEAAVVRDNDVSTTRDGVSVERSTDVEVLGNRVTNASFNGISVYDATNVTLTDNDLTRNWAGVGGRNLTAVRFVDNTVNRSENYAVRFEGVEDATLRGNVVWMNAYGIRLADAVNATVTDTTAQDHGNAGVFVERSTDVHLTNVTSVSNDVGTGIRVDDSNRTTVVRSEVTENRYGVRIHGGRGVVVRNVTAAGNQYEGIRLFETTNVTVEESHATDNRFGLKLIATSNSTVADTNASNNHWGGVRIEDDSWKGNGVGPATGNRLVNLTAADNHAAGVRLVSTNGTLVRNASIVGNDAPGLWLSGTNETRLMRVNFSGNVGTYTVLAAGGSTVERARNVSLGDGTVVGFEGTDFTLDTVEAQHRPADPDGYGNISRYVSVTPTSNDPSLVLTVNYTDQTVTDAGVDEGTLLLWRYDDGWSQLEDENTVNTMTNTVSATIRSFGIIAPLGELTNETTTSTTGGQEVPA